MKLLTRDDLDMLAHHRQGPCVSIFTPLKRGGPDKEQNRIRLKNILRKVQKRLEEVGMRNSEIEDFLEPTESFLDSVRRWKQDSDGLVIFVSPQVFRYYRVPSRFQELVVVSDRFHIKPLLPLLTGDGRFYVLAISQNDIRLLQCTHHSLREVALPEDTPISLEEAQQYDVVANGHVQFHSGGGPSGGMVFHTQADDSDKAVHKKIVREFVRQVGNGVKKVLSEERAPLVLAGVRDIRALYEDANTYQNLVEEGIDGNPDRTRAEQLREAAWEIIGPMFEEVRNQAVGAYKRFQGTGRASNDLNEVLEASSKGRVEVLLTDLNKHEWGTYDPDSGLVYLHYRQEGGDDDLLNRAALQTLLNGGSVFALETEEMPDGREVAAVYRY